MLSTFIGSTFWKGLTLRLTKNIVIRDQSKRSVFNKTTYNEEWIPRQTVYSKHRKPRQAQWDDGQYIFPKLIPPLYRPCQFRHYVKNVIEAEQMEKALRSKQYLLGDVRPGDIVDVTFQQTFESDQKVTHRCLVLAFKRKKSLSAALEVAIRFGGMTIKCIYLIHSPRVTNIQIISRGSGCFAANLKFGWDKLTKQELTTPRIRKRVMKNRFDMRKKKEEKRNQSAMKFDSIESDTVKRLV